MRPLVIIALALSIWSPTAASAPQDDVMNSGRRVLTAERMRDDELHRLDSASRSLTLDRRGATKAVYRSRF